MSPSPNPQILAKPDYAQAAPQSGEGQIDYTKLIEIVNGPLRNLLQNDVHGDVDPEKIRQYSDIRKQEYYWRGIQFLRRVMGSDGITVDWEPLNGSLRANEIPAEDLYDYVINDIRGYGRKFIGVAAQQAPNLKALPNKREDPANVKRAKTAQRVLDILRGLWDYDKQNRQLFFNFYKNGTVFLHQQLVADSQKYGWSSEPVVEMQDTPIGEAKLHCMNCGLDTPVPDAEMPPRACPECGYEFGPEDYIAAETAQLPQETGVKTYPNACVENRIYSSMYVTTPFYIQSLSDTPWLLLEYEAHKGRILTAFADRPKVYARLKEIAKGDLPQNATSAGSYGRYTRDISYSPNGLMYAPRRNRWSYSELYLRPAEYEVMTSEITTPDGRQMEAGALFKEIFKDGCCVTFVQDDVVDLRPAVIDKEWVIAIPEEAENVYPDALCKDLISSQDLTNSCYNIMAQTLERQIPQTFVDVDRISLEQHRKHHLPGGYIPVRRIAGQKLDDAIGRVTVAKAEPEQVAYPQDIREHSAEIIGITRSIFGAGEREQTAYATNLKRNQAMLQLAPALDAARGGWAAAYYNAIMMMAEKMPTGRIPSQYAPSTEMEQIELQDLLQGGWHIEPDDSMPMSWAERRATLMEMLDKRPETHGPLGFSQIENIPILQDNLIGLPDWKLPNQEALNKVQYCIMILREGQPIQQINPMTGMPDLLPSLPVDQFEDDHAFSAQTVRDWAQTDDALDLRQRNPAGYANVIAWGKAHAVLAAPPPMGPGGPGGPPGPQGGPPPPPGGPPEAGPPPGGGPPAGPEHLRPPTGGDTAQAVQQAIPQ